MTNPGRYHLLLTSRGESVQHGWWASEQTARRKFARWVGEYSAMPEPRITLVDEETDSVLASWPEED